MYLVGSVAMGDFRPPLSDVNFVAVSHRLARAGARWQPSPRPMPASPAAGRPPALDGVYLTWDGKRAGPLAVPNAPSVRQGQFFASGCHDRIRSPGAS